MPFAADEEEHLHDNHAAHHQPPVTASRFSSVYPVDFDFANSGGDVEDEEEGHHRGRGPASFYEDGGTPTVGELTPPSDSGIGDPAVA